MTNFIPIFPLGIVVYPGEDLNLHIFEPRYIQLITECFRNAKQFGIPAVIDDKMQDYGTLVKIKEVTAVHENGDMDIKTQGQKVFRILEVIKEIPDKLYSGAIVNYPDNNEKGSREMMQKVMNSIRELHKLLKVSRDFKKGDDVMSTYDVAHHIGLSLHEEYELLNLLNERQRQEYLKLHLTRVLPMAAEMENMKEKVKMNGHFRNIKGFDLNI